jgi:hypothetical protein
MEEGTIARSLGKPKIVAFDDEIHNKSVLKEGIYDVRQLYPVDYHSPNIPSNTMTFYLSAQTADRYVDGIIAVYDFELC